VIHLVSSKTAKSVSIFPQLPAVSAAIVAEKKQPHGIGAPQCIQTPSCTTVVRAIYEAPQNGAPVFGPAPRMLNKLLF
jgi:hypothetical protein